MLSRIFYAINACWRYRAQLKNYSVNSALQMSSVTQLTIQNVNVHHIQALALDFDGVLAAHAEPTLSPEIFSWLSDFKTKFAPRKIYILSNKPTLQRQEYFKQYFPDISFIRTCRKKPYPDGLQKILQDSGVPARQLLLVDDRLATGVIAAVSIGVRALWITQPCVNFKRRPIRETFFMGMRSFEKLYCRII